MMNIAIWKFGDENKWVGNYMIFDTQFINSLQWNSITKKMDNYPKQKEKRKFNKVDVFTKEL